MPIIAVCPYCRVGKLRAPSKAVGVSFPCPRCHCHFTLTDSGEKDPARKPAPDTAPVSARETQAVPAVGKDTAPQVTLPEPSPVAVEDLPPEELPALPPPRYEVVDSDTPRRGDVDPGLPWALVGLTLAGLALAASQLPYGRFVTAGLGMVALLVAAVGVFAAYKSKLVPLAGCAAGGLAVVLAVFFPGVLGVGEWIPPSQVDESKIVNAFDREGRLLPAAEWVDAGKAAWQQNDVRVSVRSAAVVPLELAGPNGARKRAKERALQIRLRVANEGVARAVEFKGWTAESAPVLTDAAGKPVAAKKFEGGWEPAEKAADLKPLFPGQASEVILWFAPPGKPQDLKLELPAAAFGGEGPVKLLLPAAVVGWGW